MSNITVVKTMMFQCATVAARANSHLIGEIMSPVRNQAAQPEQVERVDFAVPGGGTIGPRFPSWREAADHARAAIARFEYPGQQVRQDAPGFHPRRYFQEGGTLVVYSRAFVHMRTVTTPVQDRRGAATTGRRDGVACTWEIFRDGTAETCPADDEP